MRQKLVQSILWSANIKWNRIAQSHYIVAADKAIKLQRIVIKPQKKDRVKKVIYWESQRTQRSKIDVDARYRRHGQNDSKITWNGHWMWNSRAENDDGVLTSLFLDELVIVHMGRVSFAGLQFKHEFKWFSSWTRLGRLCFKTRFSLNSRWMQVVGQLRT